MASSSPTRASGLIGLSPRPAALAAFPQLFSAALFMSALLLFCVEPMIAKMLLPLLGGVPAVWSTCLVFFQAVLLLGYVFSLASLKLLGARAQALLQIALVACALLTMPIVVDGELANRFASLSPALQALAILSVAGGLPLFALSTVAPTLQRWYSITGAPRAKDPYFLYAASNVGSLVALLAYPLVVEPYLGLKQQALLLRFAYGAMALLVCTCAVGTLTSVAPARSAAAQSSQATSPGALRARTRERLLWLFLSAVPSAYLVAVTTHLTTAVAPAPFLWVLPLAAYLLSFVLVFAKRPWLSQARLVRYFPLAASLVAYLIASAAGRPLTLAVVPVHVMAFFAACALCHGELSRRRPAVERLNEFYVVLAAGGFIGGLGVALIAPQLLSVEIEYPVCLVLSLFARALWPGVAWQRRDWLIPAVVLVLSILGVAFLYGHVPHWLAGLLAVPPLFIAFKVRARAVTFALSIGALMAGSSLRADDVYGQTLLRSRNFFGSIAVTRTEKSVRLMHGTTLHGAQSRLPGLRRTPMTYYSRLGPVNDAFTATRAVAGLPARVGVIGLGVGTLATYAQPGESWTFFEIDPAVVEVATNPALFSYLADAFPGGHGLTITQGDARVALRSDPGNYGLLVVDAFSSDSIPIHLVTREALALYLQKTASSGVIAWHISNRYLKLAPVLAALGAEASVGVLRRADSPSDAEQEQAGAREASEWVVMAKDPATLARFPATWQKPSATPGRSVWTDDKSSVLAQLSF